MQIFELMGSIAIEGLDSVSSGMQGIGFSLQTLGNNITNMGKALYDGITKPLIGLVESGVTYNMTMEDLTTSFDVMLGSAEKAGKMVENLKKMGAATPFDTVQLAEYTKTMLAFGYTEANVIPIMSRLGDVSLGNNEKMSSLTRTMGQINSMGKLQGGDLNQLIGQGWNPLNEITKKTGETMEQVRARMAKGKVTYKEVEDALVSVTSKGGTFYEGMAKGSQTLSGKLSTLRDNFDSFIGDAVKPISEFIGNVLVPKLTLLTAYFSGLSTPIKTVILIVTALVAAIGPLIMIFGSVVTFAGMFATSVGVLAGILGSIGIVVPIVVAVIGTLIAVFVGVMASSEGLHAKIREVFSGIIDRVKSAANFVRQHLGDIKDAIVGLKQALTTDDFTKFGEAMGKMFPNHVVDIGNMIIKYKEFKANVIELRDKIIEFGKKVVEFITPLAEMFKKTFSSLDSGPIVKSFELLKTSIEPLIPTIKIVAEIIGGLLAVAIGYAVGYLNGMIAILPNVIGFFTSIWSVVASFFGIVVALFTNNSALLKESISNLWESIKSVFSNGIGIVKNFVMGFVDGIVTFFRSLYDTIVGHSIIPDLVNGVINWFNTLVSRVTSFVSNLVSSVINFFVSLAGNVVNYISNMVNNVINWFNNLVNQGRNLISNLVNGISSILSGLYGIASSAFSSFVSAINNKIGEAGNAASSVANSVKNAITGIAGSMYSAGTKIIQGVIDGINAMIGKVKSAAGNVAKAIKDFFPSSPAKEGPLKSIPQWMPTMINMITDDLEDGVDKVKKASLGIAKAINPVGTNGVTSGLSGLSKNVNTQTSNTNNFNLKINFDDINDVIKLKNFLNQLQVESITRGGGI